MAFLLRLLSFINIRLLPTRHLRIGFEYTPWLGTADKLHLLQLYKLGGHSLTYRKKRPYLAADGPYLEYEENT